MKFRYKAFLFVVFFMIAASGSNLFAQLHKNDKAPDFTLKDASGKSYTLSSFKGKSPVVVYFYPKAGTPGCTTEACGIRDNWNQFADHNIQVLGISVDSIDALKNFKSEYKLNFPLLSDADKKVSKAYGVLNKHGRDNRITFIVDKNGKIADVITDVDVKTHASDVLKLAMDL